MRPFGRSEGEGEDQLEAPEASGGPFRYDAFISYSRKDTAFVRKLHRALTRYRPPEDIDGQRRHLRVFRDEGDLTGADYYKAIDKHLASSGALIVVCSPSAHASEFVNDEIRRFIELRGADQIIPVLLSGVPNNEADDEAEKAFPEALYEGMTLPLANATFVGFDLARDKVDSRQFANSWYTLLANLYDVPRSEIEQRDLRRRRRVRRITVGTTAAIMSILLALTAYSVHQSRIARENAAMANREARTAGRVTEVLIDMFRSSDPAQALGDTVTAREILDRGTVQIREGLADEPEVQTRILGVLGRVYQNLGLYAEADSLVSEALEARRELYGPGSLEVAESMHDLAVVKTWQEDFQEADALFREALAIRVAELSPDHLDVADTEDQFARVLARNGQADSAVTLQRHALRVRRDRLAEDDPVLVDGLMRFAETMAYYTSDTEGALAAAREALDAATRAFGDLHPVVARAWLVVSVAHFRQGNLEESGEALHEVIRLRQVLLDPEHPEVLYAKINLASVYSEMGEHGRSEALLSEVIPVARRRLPADHGWLINPLVVLARYRLNAEDFSAAEAYAGEAVQRMAAPDEESSVGLNAQLVHGRALTGLGRFADAETVLLNAHRTIERQEREGRGDRVSRLGEVEREDRARNRNIAAEVLEALVALYERRGDEASAQNFRALLEGSG